jgi:predicted alpha/beta superfamily hydrolase
MRLNNKLKKVLEGTASVEEAEKMLDALGNAGIPSNITVAEEFRHSANPRVRASSANVVRNAQTEESEKMLFAMLDDDENLVKVHVINTLSVYKLDGEHVFINDEIVNWEGLQKSSITGDFQIFFDFKSKYLKEKRNIYVWLPPGYNNSRDSKFPLLLCQDGQNLFDASTSFLGVEWEMDEAATSLITKYEIEPMIIVGVANTTDRVYEYTPYGELEGGGGVELYGKFIVEELMPFLTKRFNINTRSGKTCTLGASTGALTSLYLYTRYPRIFNMAAIISPATFFSKGSLINWVKEQKFNSNGKIWLDIGLEEGVQMSNGISDAVQTTRDIKRYLEGNNFIDGKNFSYHEEPDGEHNEISWQKRVPLFLKYLYGKSYGSFKF